ncbi:protein-L-isoaspartate O-methyltransferase family protein [Kitasatospora sp. NPDC001664]
MTRPVQPEHAARPAAPKASEPAGEQGTDSARREFLRLLALQDGVHEQRVIASLGAVPREELMPAVFTPAHQERPATRWQAVSTGHDPATWRKVVWSMDQVVVQLGSLDATVAKPGIGHHGRPTAQSSGAGLLAITLQDLRLEPGLRLVEVGACTGVLSAAAARLTGRQVTGVEVDPALARHAAVRIAKVGADVRIVARDGLRGLPEGPWDRIAASFALSALPPSWLHRLAPRGVLTCTISTAAPGWHTRAIVGRDERGRLAGRLVADRWGHVLARDVPWLPVPDHASGPARLRSSVLAPPDFRARGFWAAVAHLLPGTRRHWPPADTDDGTVQLVHPGDGSRAHIAPDGSRCEVWGPRDLWAEAEAVHTRWTAAGSPSEFHLTVPEGRQHVDAGPGLSWYLPT